MAQHELGIDDGSRSIENILSVLDELGVRGASLSEYRSLLQEWKGNGSAEALG